LDGNSRREKGGRDKTNTHTTCDADIKVPEYLVYIPAESAAAAAVSISLLISYIKVGVCIL
jgi:hypothetical protein